MAHTYPIASDIDIALSAKALVARTRHEAEALSPTHLIAALKTEWVTPSSETLPALLEQIRASPAHGFVQHYEDASGNTVLAVTYWQTGAKKAVKKPAKPPSKAKAKAKTVPKPAVGAADHTDDLYFRSGRTKARRKKPIDPNQLDLFKGD